jgi:hypothetical protein
VLYKVQLLRGLRDHKVKKVIRANREHKANLGHKVSKALQVHGVLRPKI